VATPELAVLSSSSYKLGDDLGVTPAETRSPHLVSSEASAVETSGSLEHITRRPASLSAVGKAAALNSSRESKLTNKSADPRRVQEGSKKYPGSNVGLNLSALTKGEPGVSDRAEAGKANPNEERVEFQSDRGAGTLQKERPPSQRGLMDSSRHLLRAGQRRNLQSLSTHVEEDQTSEEVAQTGHLLATELIHQEVRRASACSMDNKRVKPTNLDAQPSQRGHGITSRPTHRGRELGEMAVAEGLRKFEEHVRV